MLDKKIIIFNHYLANAKFVQEPVTEFILFDEVATGAVTEPAGTPLNWFPATGVVTPL